MIKIETGIPVPGDSRGRCRKYPFCDMQIGDSFSAPSQSKVVSAASKYKREHPGWNYTTRRDGTGVACRIWRIS